MNTGDVVVSGIKECVVISDININVPQGEMVTIPGSLALKSRELWAYISSERLFRHNTPNFRQPPVAQYVTAKPVVVDPQSSNTNLQSELSRVQEESSKAKLDLLDRIGKLEAENSRLKVENDKKSTDRDTLNIILEKLDNLPSPTVQVVTKVQSEHSETNESDLEGKVPIYIPSLPDARSFPSRITPKVTKSDGVDVEKAGKALRQLRNKGG
jgi:hypothetical protein